MSPRPMYWSHGKFGFPRVSGDEPPKSTMAFTKFGFSPRERG